jgi:hypothetical protein
LARTHKIKSSTLQLARRNFGAAPDSTRASLRFAFSGAGKVRWWGFISGFVSLAVPLGLVAGAVFMAPQIGFKRIYLISVLVRFLEKARLGPVPGSFEWTVYLNTGALLLLAGFLGMIAALIRRSVFRRRSNLSLVAGSSRSWLELVPYAAAAVAAGFFDRPFATLHAAEAIVLFALWSFWYQLIFGGRKKR